MLAATPLRMSRPVVEGVTVATETSITPSDQHERQPFGYLFNTWSLSGADTERIPGHFDEESQTWAVEADRDLTVVMATYTKTVRPFWPDDRNVDDA